MLNITVVIVGYSSLCDWLVWLVYHKRMHSLGINGEGELRGDWLTEVHLENGN